jgi:OOP family OmpA-OmpF porin
MKIGLLLGALLCWGLGTSAQAVGDVLKQQAGQGVKDGTTIATEQTANNASNRLLNKLFSKKTKNGKTDSAKAAAAATGGAPSTGNVAAVGAGAVANASANSASGTGATAAGAGSALATLQTYSKFDFVPGDKILAVEDFSQDSVGDFPDKWNTNSAGEVRTIGGREGKWLSLNKKGIYLPEFITNLPENFTLQFDLLCTDNISYGSGNFDVSFDVIPNQQQFATLGHGVPRNEASVFFQPRAGSDHGLTGFAIFSNNDQLMNNEVNQADWLYNDPRRRMVKISFWRQRQRLRVYMDQEKVWDLPRAFETGKNYNTVLLRMEDGLSGNDLYLISNIRLAVGAPDTRNKLIVEGKFSTTGILFDVNSAVLKPDSYGALKDIADVLKDNPTVKVKIVGHTDSDGDAAQNMVLSGKRAEAVREALTKEFGIDASRMATEGKGATQPVASNSIPAGKAQNRLVEFIKQ